MGHVLWCSVMSGLITSKSRTSLALVRLPICRWRLTSGDERQRRQKIIECQRGRGALRNRGALTLLGHRLQWCHPPVARRGGRSACIAQNEVSSLFSSFHS